MLLAWGGNNDIIISSPAPVVIIISSIVVGCTVNEFFFRGETEIKKHYLAQIILNIPHSLLSLP